MGAACQNCKHLGHKCTFEFAAARAAARQAKKATSSATRRLSSITQEQPESPTFTSSTGVSSTGLSWMESLPLIDVDMNLDLGLDNAHWAEFDLNESAFDYGITLPNGTEDGINLNDKPSAGLLEFNATSTPSICPRWNKSQSLQKHREPQQPSQSILLGAWHGSPVRLLNSKVVAQHCSEALCRIYDSMMIGLANRHLAYRCNQFAGGHSYVLEHENEPKQPSKANPSQQAQDPAELLDSAYSQNVMTNGMTSPLYANQNFSDDSYSSERVVQPYIRLTLIGVARFLDNFGALYGNRLDKRKRMHDEEALTAVLHAFALQAISDDENPQQSPLSALGLETLHNTPSQRNNVAPSRETFCSAWFKAHSLLLRAKDVRSFLHMHTVFLFHIIAPPQEVLDQGDFEGDAAQLLDDALHQLQSLLELVESFRARIDPKSVYYSMLESSMRIVQWFGYVRDTLSSFVSKPVRCSVMEDIQVTSGL